MRRFRGRLSAPVTVVTAGDTADPVGLTVSSLVVAGEGASGRVHFVIGPDSYVWDAIQEYGRFTVHILEATQRGLADQFAGVRPSPGGPFSGLEITDAGFGPAIAECPNRVGCLLEGVVEGEDYLLVQGRIAPVELADLDAPLQWFRGRYRTLEGS